MQGTPAILREQKGTSGLKASTELLANSPQLLWESTDAQPPNRSPVPNRY